MFPLQEFFQFPHLAAAVCSVALMYSFLLYIVAALPALLCRVMPECRLMSRCLPPPPSRKRVDDEFCLFLFIYFLFYFVYRGNDLAGRESPHDRFTRIFGIWIIDRLVPPFASACTCILCVYTRRRESLF